MERPTQQTDGLVPGPVDAAVVPAQLGYRMPAEWEPQLATWLTWPHNPRTWPDRLHSIPPVYARLAAEFARVQEVRILVENAAMADAARAAITAIGGKISAVSFYEIPTNDSWIRDSGPTFITRSQGEKTEGALVGWRYNAWGGKYPPWDRDVEIPRRLSERLSLPLFSPGIILEGGSIDVNGQGTLITTEQCLLNRNRNPHLSREEIEKKLCDYLGATHIVWLGDGIAGDDTDGHVDDITRFVAPNIVVTVLEDDPLDPNHGPLRDNFERLSKATNERGEKLRVVPLPMPTPLEIQGHRVPASYANFCIVNGKVVVPIFGDRKDELALDALRGLFPDRQVVGLRADDLIWGLGAFHCITQQQPRID